ncbi:MAG: hypothetical protein LBU48_01155 [Coriobacteriales bacterium]|jgi:hypothetical protein|nr:hypothetical protein [Coriobacteriales bacterium]
MNIILKIVLLSLLSIGILVATIVAALAFKNTTVGLLVGLIGSVAFLAVLGYLVYSPIHFALEKNRSYERYAIEHGWLYEKAQARAYVHYSRVPKVSITFDPGDVLTKEFNQLMREKTGNLLGRNPYIERFAPFVIYPFMYGTNKGVINVVSGVYRGYEFNAFTYFTMIGGWVTFGIIALKSIAYKDDKPKVLENSVRCESGYLYTVEQSMLKVEHIIPTLDELIRIDRQSVFSP